MYEPIYKCMENIFTSSYPWGVVGMGTVRRIFVVLVFTVYLFSILNLKLQKLFTFWLYQK